MWRKELRPLFLTLALAGTATAAPAPPLDGTPARLDRAVREEIALPPPFGGTDQRLPRFAPGHLKRYGAAKAPAAKFQAAVRKAQVALWAVSPAEVSAEMGREVQALRKAWKVGPGAWKSTYRAPAPGPGAENRFREVLFMDSKALSRMVWHLTEALDELKAIEGQREAQPPRWQANYDLVRARLQAQIVLSEQHQAALGLLRRDPPPLDPLRHTGWRLIRMGAIRGDGGVRNLALATQRLFERVSQEHPGTIWAELARRARASDLGLTWEAVR